MWPQMEALTDDVRSTVVAEACDRSWSCAPYLWRPYQSFWGLQAISTHKVQTTASSHSLIRRSFMQTTQVLTGISMLPVRINVRRKSSSNCLSVAMFPLHAIFSAHASSTASVKKEHGAMGRQWWNACLSKLQQQMWNTALSLAECVANIVTHTQCLCFTACWCTPCVWNLWWNRPIVAAFVCLIIIPDILSMCSFCKVWRLVACTLDIYLLAAQGLNIWVCTPAYLRFLLKSPGFWDIV